MPAFAVRAHVRQECPDAVNDAHQIDVKHPTPAIERDVVNSAARGHAGVVAHHMNVSECVECGLRGALDAGRIRDVAIDAAHLGADVMQALDCRRQRIRFDVSEHDFHACLGESASERKTDAARSARHECCLAGKLPHVSPSNLLC